MAVNRRILLFLTDLKIGGTPLVVRELAARLNHPPRVSLHVACLDRRGPVADQIQQRGVGVTALNAQGPLDVTALLRFIELVSYQRFDTVLSFLVHANAVAAAASPFCPGVRFLQSIQTTQRHPRWHWWVQRVAQHRADRVIVPSPSVADVAHRWAGVPDAKIAIVHNGIDIPDAPPAAPSPQLPHRVVFLGRLDPVKRLPDLLAAMPRLRGFARLDIYGEGSQRPLLERRIETLGLRESVTLHGAVNHPAEALRGAELLVLPSEAEGFGMVLIEAMVAGVPIVATDAPGIRDVVRDGVTGLLVPVGAPAAMAAGIRNVLEDQNLRHSMIAAAWADVQKRFTWHAAIAQYRRLLRV
jgi:glycosyltransferase involved in cell wall biosynthesis